MRLVVMAQGSLRLLKPGARESLGPSDFCFCCEVFDEFFQTLFRLCGDIIYSTRIVSIISCGDLHYVGKNLLLIAVIDGSLCHFFDIDNFAERNMIYLYILVHKGKGYPFLCDYNTPNLPDSGRITQNVSNRGGNLNQLYKVK
jgi:hypothetical protein